MCAAPARRIGAITPEHRTSCITAVPSPSPPLSFPPPLPLLRPAASHLLFSFRPPSHCVLRLRRNDAHHHRRTRIAATMRALVPLSPSLATLLSMIYRTRNYHVPRIIANCALNLCCPFFLTKQGSLAASEKLGSLTRRMYVCDRSKGVLSPLARQAVTLSLNRQVLPDPRYLSVFYPRAGSLVAIS